MMTITMLIEWNELCLEISSYCNNNNNNNNNEFNNNNSNVGELIHHHPHTQLFDDRNITILTPLPQR